MLRLANSDLTVELLDPASAADTARQGPRFCWGGYIWQIRDAAGAPLLAGPEWPLPDPIAFNGQGLPESFRHAELATGRPLLLEDGRGFIIGVGDVAPGPDGLALTAPARWAITPLPHAIEFCTAQQNARHACSLTRHIALAGRVVTSLTRVVNHGTQPMPLHWFAHPFFALTDRLLTADLPSSWGMADNIGYALDAQHRLTFKRRFLHKDDGHFEYLRIGAEPLHVRLSHPHLAWLDFSTDFVPDLCPVWGNSNTWSIEPYITTELAPGAARQWTLRYEFGPAA
ncbi:hypothetical protein K0B96_15585 [Horticoccus luteus]|uniref:Uncharacterized protein n=1 Tax=Horticoccus luteus TaxID=2862869 RepID=A0A8F9TUU9_9BACT|nr:hypothetical protein [Horticoccus luteus]QYM78703.1 hypothetical protein K0B96_15585 [Horticoccus luteus]